MKIITENPNRTKRSLLKAAAHLGQFQLLPLRSDDAQARNVAAVLRPLTAKIEWLGAAL